jgi:hypothetical protein
MMISTERRNHLNQLANDYISTKELCLTFLKNVKKDATKKEIHQLRKEMDASPDVENYKKAKDVFKRAIIGCFTSYATKEDLQAMISDCNSSIAKKIDKWHQKYLKRSHA